MTKHSKRERDQRATETERVRQIEDAWSRSVPSDKARAFAMEVEAARTRGPLPNPPDMAPGTPPRPPRPGREPKVPRDTGRPRRGR